MSISEALEKFRFVVFMGNVPQEVVPTQHEEYVDHYEQRLERDPAMEIKLISEYSKPLLPIYRKHVEGLAKMEQTLSGSSEPISFTDEEIINELYDEVMNIDSEEEWQHFTRIFA